MILWRCLGTKFHFKKEKRIRFNFICKQDFIMCGHMFWCLKPVEVSALAGFLKVKVQKVDLPCQCGMTAPIS